MAEHHARQGLDLHVAQAVALHPGEVAHLGLGELDVVALLGGQGVHAGVDLRLAQAAVLPVPAVEPDRHLAHGRVAPRLDVGERGLDDVAHLAVGVGLRLRGGAALQVMGHGCRSGRGGRPEGPSQDQAAGAATGGAAGARRPTAAFQRSSAATPATDTPTISPDTAGSDQPRVNRTPGVTAARMLPRRPKA